VSARVAPRQPRVHLPRGPIRTTSTTASRSRTWVRMRHTATRSSPSCQANQFAPGGLGLPTPPGGAASIRAFGRWSCMARIAVRTRGRRATLPPRFR
jgi:hypothetical protein